MTSTTVRTDIPRIRHADAARLAHHVEDRMIALLEQLDPEDWHRRTDCTAWDVSDMVGHLIGAAKGHASLRETVRQVVYGRRHEDEHDGNAMDAMNALQVRDHAHLTPTERVAALRAITPAAVRRRVRTPGPIGRLPLPIAAGTGSLPDGLPRRISLRYLNDVILTRDVLMHRVDIARATDRDPHLDEVDGEIVADVVAEWADTHGQPFTLRLDGPAGGVFRRGAGGPELTTDVVTFLRSLTGRCEAEGLLSTPVLF